MCNPEQCDMVHKEGVLWGDIGMYGAQLWIPPQTVTPKPGLRGREEVTKEEVFQGKGRST